MLRAVIAKHKEPAGRRRYQRKMLRDPLVQARPIVGQEDGVAGIGGVVFDAGGLAGGYAAQVLGFFQAGDVLRGFVGDAGD